MRVHVLDHVVDVYVILVGIHEPEIFSEKNQQVVGLVVSGSLVKLLHQIFSSLWGIVALRLVIVYPGSVFIEEVEIEAFWRAVVVGENVSEDLGTSS